MKPNWWGVIFMKIGLWFRSWVSKPGLEIILNLLDTWAFCQKPTVFFPEKARIQQPLKPSFQRQILFLDMEMKKLPKKFPYVFKSFIILLIHIWKVLHNDHIMVRFCFMVWADVNIYLNRFLNGFFNNQFKISRIQLNDKKKCFE